jgi:hypothetical protein
MLWPVITSNPPSVFDLRSLECNEAAIHLDWFAECNHLFSKGTDRLRLCQGRLDSILLDEAQTWFAAANFDARLSGPI